MFGSIAKLFGFVVFVIVVPFYFLITVVALTNWGFTFWTVLLLILFLRYILD
jgi:hypothetical protein